MEKIITNQGFYLFGKPSEICAELERLSLTYALVKDLIHSQLH